jgi:hypothetical protein
VTRPGVLWAVDGDVIAHLAGGSWSTETVPDGVTVNYLTAGFGEVWAAGIAKTGRWVLLQRDSTGWNVVRRTRDRTVVYGLEVSPSGHVWAVGSTRLEGAGKQVFVLRQDDGGWHRYIFGRGEAHAVDVARGQAWVVGFTRRWRSFSLHRTETGWERERMFAQGPHGVALAWGVAVGSRGPVWAIASDDAGDCCHYLNLVVRHWQGAWGDPMPTAGVTGYPTDIAVDASGRTAAVVGTNFAGDGGGGHDYGFLEEWDGTKWTGLVPEGVTPTGNAWYYSGVDTDSDDGRWATGRSPTGESLVVYQCRPTGLG